MKYHYGAFCTDVYDGDTVTVTLDQGLGTKQEGFKCRLFGVNTPELRGGTEETKAEGRKVRDWLREKVLNKHIEIRTIKDKKGKYGRYLGILFVDGVNLNEELKKMGYAHEY